MNIKTIHIHFSFCLYLLITLYGGLLKESFFFLTCLIIHEVGHLIMIGLTRNKIKKINLTCLGFFIDLKTNSMKFKHKVLIYSGGLIASAIFQFFLSLKGSHQIFVFNAFILSTTSNSASCVLISFSVPLFFIFFLGSSFCVK